MNLYKSIPSLKAEARQRLIGSYPVSIACILTFYFINMAYSLLPSAVPLSEANTAGAFIIRGLLFIFSSILIYRAKFGVYNFFLQISCRKKLKGNSIYALCFPLRISRTEFSLATFRSIIDCLFVGAFIFIDYYSGKVDSTISIVCLYIVLAVLALFYIYVEIMFTPLYFLASDIKGHSALQLILLSSWLIKGQKMKLIKLRLSFIPMLLLGLMSFGVGLLYVYPYQFTTMAAFYNDLTNVKSK